MKIHSTNYSDTFIEVSGDTKAICGVIPPNKPKKTVAEMHYEIIANNPYQFTSDDVFFQVYVIKNDLTESEYSEARKVFFSKGQPCMRTSPLTKTYGFGIHHNEEGKIALYGMETTEYHDFITDPKIKKVKAMKSRK